MTIPLTHTHPDLDQGTRLEPWTEPETAARTRNEALQLLRLRVRDINWQLRARKGFAGVIFILLVLQNIVVFGLVYLAFFFDRLSELEIIFSVLMGGTLIETVAVIKIIVQWLFQNINYDADEDLLLSRGMK